MIWLNWLVIIDSVLLIWGGLRLRTVSARGLEWHKDRDAAVAEMETLKLERDEAVQRCATTTEDLIKLEKSLRAAPKKKKGLILGGSS